MEIEIKYFYSDILLFRELNIKTHFGQNLLQSFSFKHEKTLPKIIIIEKFLSKKYFKEKNISDCINTMQTFILN